MKELKQKVEDLGVVFEKLGRTPMLGRVFATLLLADPPRMSFDEIREFLGASKSSVSNALQALQLEGTVSYQTFSGDRKRYFKIDTNAWLKLLMNSSKNLASLNEVIETVLSLRKKTKDPNFNAELTKVLDFQLFLSDRIEQAILEWSKK